MAEGTVYLIHFDTPYRHAQHYIGWALDLNRRVRHHRNGTGARLLRIVNEAGIPWEVVRTWPGDKRLERAKKNGHARMSCPVCRAQEKGRDLDQT